MIYTDAEKLAALEKYITDILFNIRNIEKLTSDQKGFYLGMVQQIFTEYRKQTRASSLMQSSRL
jgi:hypothetical protein